jgi:hypothetical protein
MELVVVLRWRHREGFVMVDVVVDGELKKP